MAVYNKDGQRTAGRTVQVALNAACSSIVAGCGPNWHKQNAHDKVQGMRKPAALNVSLTPELVTFVAAQVGSGRYGSASEVVRSSLRLVEEHKRRSTASPMLIGAPAPVVPNAR